MNAQRRKKIADIHKLIEELRDKVEGLRDEEEEAYENLPESLQESERGDAMQEAIQGLDDLYNELDGAVAAASTLY